MDERRSPRIEWKEPREQARRFDVATIEMLGGRNEQQDAHASIQYKVNEEPALAVAVADGHGLIGLVAAKRSVEFLTKEVSNQETVSDLWLTETFANLQMQTIEFVREKMIQEGAEEAELPEADPDGLGGTTLTLVSMKGNELTIAYVGDSEARSVSASGDLTQLTPPHRFGAHPGESRRLRDQGAKIVDRRRNEIKGNDVPGYISHEGAAIEVTRAIGDTEFRGLVSHVPEIVRTSVTPTDKFLLLASDGFWDFLDTDEGRKDQVQQIFKTSTSAKGAEEKLRALLRGAQSDLEDNTTVAIVDLQ